VIETRLAEMHLRVDHAREDMEAGAVDRPPGRRAYEIADGGDPAVRDADVPRACAVVVHDGSAGQNEVKGLGHRLSLRRMSLDEGRP
jgi:hypothetical protein